MRVFNVKDAANLNSMKQDDYFYIVNLRYNAALRLGWDADSSGDRLAWVHEGDRGAVDDGPYHWTVKMTPDGFHRFESDKFSHTKGRLFRGYTAEDGDYPIWGHDNDIKVLDYGTRYNFTINHITDDVFTIQTENNCYLKAGYDMDDNDHRVWAQVSNINDNRLKWYLVKVT
jgi:hypothetical protein